MFKLKEKFNKRPKNKILNVVVLELYNQYSTVINDSKNSSKEFLLIENYRCIFREFPNN